MGQRHLPKWDKGLVQGQGGFLHLGQCYGNTNQLLAMVVARSASGRDPAAKEVDLITES